MILISGSSFLRSLVLTGMVLLLAGCAGAAPQPVDLTPTARAIIPTVPVTPTLYGGESAQLGPLPHSCPLSPPPAIRKHGKFGQFEGPAVGFGPVWVGIDGYQHLPLAVLWDKRDAPKLHTPQGWSTKLAWLVSRDYHGEVMFSGHSIEDGLPLYPEARYALQEKSTLTVLVVNPNDAGVTQAYPDPKWSVFVGGITIPHAGCYQLDAQWKGGQWSIVFAAGVVAFG